MNIDDLRGLATLFVFIAFLAICYWAYSGKQKKRFDEAANLPFADDDTTADGDTRAADDAADNKPSAVADASKGERK